MSTRRSTRLSAAVVTAMSPVLIGKDDAFDGELSELSEPDTEMAIEATKNAHESASEAEEEHEDEGEWSEVERPAKRRKATNGKATTTSTRTKSARNTSKKKVAAPKTKPAARSRVQGRLKNIMSMPLDVLFEIFYELQPSDLLAIARTSKILRRVMMNRSHTGVWKAARGNVPGLPALDPPVGMSEPAWAQLLFGGSGCYSCGTKNVQRIDFGLQRRLCTSCKKQSLVWSARFAKLCDGMDPALMDLVGYTNVGGHSHGHASNSRFYWKQDLLDMERRLAELRKGPGGLKAVREFRAQRIVEVDQLMQDVEKYELWASTREERATAERTSIQDRNYENIVARLTDAGYSTCDVPSFYEIKASVSGKQELTDASWKRLRAKIEPMVIKSRDRRLEHEEKTRVERRTRTAAWLYRDYLHALVPVQWRYLPTPQHLIDTECRDIPSFKALIGQKERPTEGQWDEAVIRLPAELSAHLVSQVAVLKQAMPDLTDAPESFEFALAADGSDSFALDTISARFAYLDLARAVFMRGDHDWTSGCDNPHTWDLMSTSTAGGRPTLNPRGSAAVCAVATLVGKMFATVTTTELDVACGDTWIRCTCTEKPGSHWVDFKGWRGFVDHCIRQAAAEQKSHQPILVPPETAPGAVPKRTEGTGHRQWACVHCPEYGQKLNNLAISVYSFTNGAFVEHSAKEAFVKYHGRASFALGQHADLIQHNKTKHNIENPVEHYDYFYYAVPGGTRPVTSTNVTRKKAAAPPPQAKAPSGSTAKSPVTGGFKCMYCLKPGLKGRDRVFTVESGVRAHIMAKHRDAIGSKTEQTLALAADFALASWALPY